jgi:predicted nucleic acid-binding protein
MNVIVDTPIWSLAHRRRQLTKNQLIHELTELLHEDRATITGPIRQELLSGIRDELQFHRLRQALRSQADLPLETDDYVTAASFSNMCRSHAVQGSTTDFLICAVGIRRGCAIFTTDGDFKRFARVLPIKLHELRE